MRYKIITVLVFFVFLLLIVLPIYYWSVKEPIQLNISVIDKSVPNKSFNDHLGLFWLLDNMKVVKENGEIYNYKQDYLGYDPYNFEGDKKLLFQDNLDLIYIADTYGVYLSGTNNEDKYSVEPPQLVYGGLSIFEWNRILEAKKKNTTLIVEYKTLEPPTDELTRDIMEKNLSIQWTGWIAKYYPNLKKSKMPDWLIRNYEHENRSWNYKGNGIVLVNGKNVVVLDNQYFDSRITFDLTAMGENHFAEVKTSEYNRWFEITKPIGNMKVEGVFNLHLNDSGEDKLTENGIPLEIPAILHHSENKIYYFTGDFAYSHTFYWYKWVLPSKIQNMVAYFENRDEFYWKTYEPMMRKVIQEIQSNKHLN